MKNGLRAFLGLLAGTSLFICQPGSAAGAAVDLAAVETTLRRADADWATAANSAGVEAWLAFYAADAAVLLPNDRLAHGPELLRYAVTRLLALPQFSVAWHPIKVELAPSGDLALMIEAYELRFSDSHGVPVANKGRRLEIWRLQADGAWKCSVDTWSFDEPNAAPVPLPAPPPALLPAPLLAPPPASVPQPTSVMPAHVAASKYGDMPTAYQDAINRYFVDHLKYPDSVQYQQVTQPEKGYTTAITGTFLMSETREYGWIVKATINAKNSHEAFVGFKTYTFLFRGEKIADVRSPLPADEMN